jgi:hypothetical protein
MTLRQANWTLWALGVTLFAFCIFGHATGQEIKIVSPSETADMEGNSEAPTGLASRGQILYPAEDFLALPDSHRLITGLAFRTDGDNTFAGPISGPARLTLSTTDANELDLESDFDDNLGDDATVVFAGTLIWQTDDFGAPPRDFDLVVRFDETFTYDASRGNLLLEFFIAEDWDIAEQIGLDRHVNSGGPITAVSSFDPLAASPGFGNPAHLVTQFTFVPEPSTTILAAISLLGLAHWRRRNLSGV